MCKKNLKIFEEASPDIDLKSIIHDHTRFFDKLVELIPARFYLPIDDKEKPWFQGLSKKEKASAKKEAKENIKKARRNRLDPEKSNITTLDLLKQNLEKEKPNGDSDDEETEIMIGFEGDDRSVTYEELRLRLKRKIEELRTGRNTGSSDKPKKRNEKSDKKEIQQKKRKRESGGEEKRSTVNNSADNVEKDIVEASKKLAFTHVKIGDEEKHSKKKKKLSKFEELEKAQKLEEAKRDPEKGEMIAKKHSWQTATSRAAGMKVHDNPKLLKLRIQKEKKRHQKNVGKWNERIETREKMKAEKQQKRSANISERIHQKKMRRIEKREKKLMRPGFEGRKDGFINEGAA